MDGHSALPLGRREVASSDPALGFRRDRHRSELRLHPAGVGNRFIANLGAVRGQGFDGRFIRMWEYYLAISEAGFATGLTQDFELVLEKKRGLEA